MTRPHQHKYRQPRPPGKWLAVICIFLFELLFYTWARVESTQTVFDISKARYDQKKTAAYHTALTLERARLISPDWISQIARTELKLAAPTPDQVIYIFGGEN